jgi:hypothetical protein
MASWRKCFFFINLIVQCLISKVGDSFLGDGNLLVETPLFLLYGSHFGLSLRVFHLCLFKGKMNVFLPLVAPIILLFAILDLRKFQFGVQNNQNWCS